MKSKSKTPNLITRFFWFCAGAEPEILLRKDCYLDRGKLAATGGTVLITAVTAALAGGYAFYTVFKFPEAAIIFAVFWGIAIGTLDRFFLLTTRKVSSFGDFLTGGLRILMAVLISFTMAIPLQLQIFSAEIEAEIQRNNIEAQREIEETVASYLAEDIEQLEQDNQRLQEELNTQQERTDQAYEEAIAEAEGTSGTGLEGRGPVFQEKWDKYNRERARMEEVEARVQPLIDENNSRINSLREEYNEEVARIEEVQQSANTLLAQIQALHELSNREVIVKYAVWLITALLVAIDIFPLLGKFLSPGSQYDYILRTEQEKTMIRQQQELNDFREQVEKESELNRQLQKKQQNFAMRSYDDLEHKIWQEPAWQGTESEILITLINRTKERILNEMENSQFITEAHLKNAINQALPSILEEVANNVGKEVVDREYINQVKSKTLEKLRERLDHLLL